MQPLLLHVYNPLYTYTWLYISKQRVDLNNDAHFKYKHNMFCIINILYTYLNLMPMFTKSGTSPRSRVESHSRWPISLSLLHDMTQSTLVPSFSAASKCRNHQLLRSKFGIHGFWYSCSIPFAHFPLPSISLDKLPRHHWKDGWDWRNYPHIAKLLGWVNHYSLSRTINDAGCCFTYFTSGINGIFMLYDGTSW